MNSAEAGILIARNPAFSSFLLSSRLFPAQVFDCVSAYSSKSLYNARLQSMTWLLSNHFFQVALQRKQCKISNSVSPHFSLLVAKIFFPLAVINFHHVFLQLPPAWRVAAPCFFHNSPAEILCRALRHELCGSF